ncbi:MAG: hypothetical protein QG640_584 [Patescibacteria group bacterium]|nr:hypothetical protein [Patescibacteria group bacterium]
MASSSDNFKKMFAPEHPHLRLHVLLAILAFSVVSGSVTLYQINNDTGSKVAIQPVQQKTGDQREKVLLSLQEQAAKSPPISDAERDHIIENLKQAITQENK